MTKQNIVAIDVGFESTKTCYRDRTGQLITESFPSLAPVADSVDLSLEGVQSDDICQLTIDGVPRLFGPIDRVFVVGGGASYYAPALREKFPGRPVHLSRCGIYTNVRGFQLAGEMLVNPKAEVIR